MKRKLAWFGIGFAGAELFAAYMPPLVLVPAAALLVLLLFLLWRHRTRPLFLGSVCGLCCFALFSWLVVAPIQSLAGRTCTCTVVVEGDAETSFQEGRLRGTLRVRELDGKPADFLLYCQAFPGTEAGEQFTAQFVMQPLEDNRYQKNYQSDGVFLQAEYMGNYQSLPDSGAFRFVLLRLRQEWAARLQRWLPKDLGELEAALLLGEKSALRDSTQDVFRAAGVSHLLAVSGLHVALLCGVFTPGRKRRFQRPFLVCRAALVLFYMLLTGMSVSVQRAGLVFLLSLAGDFFLQPVDLLTSTGAAAIVLSLSNAYAPCDVGFQLSFSAVLGVQVAGGLFQWEQRRLQPAKQGEQKAARGKALLLRLLNDVQVAALATLATLPILIAHGMTASGTGVLTNVLVVWMLRYLLLLGIGVLVLSAVPFAAPLMHLASLILAVWLQVLLSVVSWCASLPLAHLYLPPRYTMLVLVLLGLLAILFYWAGSMTWYLPTMALCMVTAVVLGAVAQRDVVTVALVGTANNPCVVCLQNDASLVLFRGGQSNLRAVREYLTNRGQSGIDLLVDLRQNPGELAFDAARIVSLEEQSTPYDQCPVLDGAMLDLYHRSSGNLAVLGVGDRHLAVMAGKIKLEQPLYVDVLCAAGTLSESVQSDTILSCSRAPSWVAELEEETVLYGSEEPAVILRPGKSMTFEEVEPIALQ